MLIFRSFYELKHFKFTSSKVQGTITGCYVMLLVIWTGISPYYFIFAFLVPAINCTVVSWVLIKWVRTDCPLKIRLGWHKFIKLEGTKKHSPVIPLYSVWFNPIYHVSVDHQHKFCYCWTQTLWNAKILPKKKIFWKKGLFYTEFEPGTKKSSLTHLNHLPLD